MGNEHYDEISKELDEVRIGAAQLAAKAHHAMMRAIAVNWEARDERTEWLKTQPPPDWLGELLSALGWQGGTIHDALQCVRRMVAVHDEAKSIAARIVRTYPHWAGPTTPIAVAEILEQIARRIEEMP